MKPSPPGELEVDLVLEEDGRLAEEIAHAPEELVPVEEGLEPRVVRVEVLDAVDEPMSRLAQALLAVDHPGAGLLGPGLDLVGGPAELGDLAGAEEAAADEEAVASIVGELPRGEEPRPTRVLGHGTRTTFP